MFQFHQSSTDSYDFSKILKDEDRAKRLNILRESVRASLDQEWGTKILAGKILQYHQELVSLIGYEEDQKSAGNEITKKSGIFKTSMQFEFSWATVVSASYKKSFSTLAKRKVKIEGNLLYEQIMLLAALAMSMMGQAHSLEASSKTGAEDSPVKLNEAADLLCQAAGIFEYIQGNITPRWINLPSNRPPEVVSETLKALRDLCMGLAHYVVFRKAEILQKIKGKNLAKILLCSAEFMIKADQTLSGMKADYADFDDDFKEYVKAAPVTMKGIAILEMAKDFHENGKVGVSVLLASESKRYLSYGIESPCALVKKLVGGLLEEATSYESKYIKVNDNVTYDKVPDQSELASFMPPSASILTSKPFSPGIE